MINLKIWRKTKRKMKLNDYLKLVRDCSDEELESRGIKDNFVVDLHEGYAVIKDYFLRSPMFLFRGEGEYDNLATFHYIPGTVAVQVRHGQGSFLSAEDCSSSIIFHCNPSEKTLDYNPGTFRETTKERALVHALTEVNREFIARRNLSHTLPEVDTLLERERSKREA